MVPPFFSQISSKIYCHVIAMIPLPRTLTLLQRSEVQHLYLSQEDTINGISRLSTIADADALFNQYGISPPRAPQKGPSQSGRSLKDIKHIVAVTCTNMANPGFDITLRTQLGLSPTVHRTLLHGLGCAGGIAVLRTAHGSLFGMSLQGVW
ncbi:hypothetical protein BBP40_004499 [Aspergillus hancockii]|nr:hypothetical protein BBP40_004499 [Aspergillus hancockii]